MVFQATQNLGQIDPNLHNHVSYDVICKPPIAVADIMKQKLKYKPWF